MKELSPLERAVEYIEAHLNEDIGLRDVARGIGYSYYHMTRLFSSVLGESAGRYIQRRRLYQASRQLLRSGRSVIEIALDSGFASPEAFSRAFKGRLRQQPGGVPQGRAGPGGKRQEGAQSRGRVPHRKQYFPHA